MLQYRNTPDRDTRLSPAMCVFGRPIRDFIPIHPGKYNPHPTWRDTLRSREDALRNRHMRAAERLSEHTRSLPPLSVGDCVRIQNQVGPFPNKWDKTGVVVEVRQFDQYVVRVDGSGRVTLRNRKFLRKYIPVVPRAPLQTLPGLTLRQSTPVDPDVLLPPHPDATIEPSSATPQPTPSEPSAASDTVNPRQHPNPPMPRALKNLLPHNAPGRLELFEPTDTNGPRPTSARRRIVTPNSNAPS